MSEKFKLAVSMDFTETSRHSFSESLYLAKRADLEVVIIHINSDREKTENDFREIIDQMIIGNGLAAKEVEISFRIIPGEKSEIVDRLSRTIEQINPMYVMVGYELKYGVEQILGTNIKNIIYGIRYPVIALKKNESLKGLSTLHFPLTLEPFSRQKTNASISFCKTMDISMRLFPLRIRNTRKDNVNQNIITNCTMQKFEEYKMRYSVEWIEGEEEVDILQKISEMDESAITALVFESSPDVLDHFRASREERILRTTAHPLLIVKSQHSPFMY